ncbi:uncharacterized protein H6S33_006679 [Morchella sextelata]|uniref:uncharacterized protein n=1 Tax=Morchella sextelata TaxID=1174677 RepID=UPI001D03CA02|nr:uncharacterized protein H6S33_006679 [Morchella sextelata]KAH0604302.1 hypothetical protein H6S33_006679 [Morchella sextelata]
MAPQVPRVFLLPKNDASTPFTIVTLPHPRTSVPTRFLLHGSTGLHEITKIVPASSAPRSWLLAPTTDTDTDTKTKTADTWLGTGQTLSDATLYLTTPYDPLFLLLPLLLPPVPTPTSTLYQPLDDLLDALAESEAGAEEGAEYHWAAVLAAPRCRAVLEARVKAISETTTPATGAYRPALARAMAVLAKKCEAMAAPALPGSMEAAAVGRALSAGGAMGVEGVVAGVERLGVSADKDAADAAEDERLRRLLRLRTAAEFLGGAYLAAHHAEALMVFLAGRWDFGAVEVRVGEVRAARNEVAVLRSGDFAIGGGRGGGGGGGGGEKKRRKKKEEEEEERKKRAPAASKAVRDLGKVNTRGMAKMTSFFKKKET